MAWEPSIDSQILAIHGAVLPTGTQGEILLFGGDEHWGDQQEPGGDFRKTRVYDVATNTIVAAAIPSPDSDVFCAGHAFTADGRLLIVGGTKSWSTGHGHDLAFAGHRRCWLYNPRERTWREVAQLLPDPYGDGTTGGGRWYPGALTLGNGEVLGLMGHILADDSRHRNASPEKYNVYANSWTGLPKMANDAYNYDPDFDSLPVRFLFFTRAFQLPDGKVFFATGMPVDYAANYSDLDEPTDGPHFSTRYDPLTGDYVGHKSAEPLDYVGWSFPCVMLPLLPEENYRPRIMHCGRNVAKKIDLDPSIATPEWAPTAATALNKTRVNSCAVILPTGKIAVVGGVENQGADGDQVLPAEIYEPGINWATGQYSNPDSWTADNADLPVNSRNYHSMALLLPNGKVLTAGGDKNGAPGNPNIVGIKKIELFVPPYPAGPRPTITAAPKSISYGRTFTVTSPNADIIQRVALVRNGSCTHAYDFDQRYVGLTFTHTPGSTELTVTAPPSGNVAPPGYYMLWLIDTTGRPCQLAKFIRVTNQDCYIVTDRSTFSSLEVSAKLPNAVFSQAFYAVFDGFLPEELGVPGADPTVTFHFNTVTGANVPSMQLDGAPTLENEATLGPDIPRRITYRFNLRFTNADAFSFMTETREVYIKVSKNGYTCSAPVILTNQPNPYMVDGPTSWLSTDVRVFQVPEGGTAPGIGSIVQGASATTFIQNILGYYNDPSRRNSPTNPFHSISEDQSTSRLELSRMVSGTRIYNYAIVKVRYVAAAVPATNVRVFFRLFNTAGTAMQFNRTTTYRRTDNPNPIALLGFEGGEISSIPFFAEARRNTSIHSMEDQIDPFNVKTLEPNGANEFIGYFGCWLDINQDHEKRFTIADNGNGPFTMPPLNLRSIMELIRGVHQCLVAEVHFDPDGDNIGMIPPNATPGSSDKLSQRNLAIVESDNPGNADTHTIQHTFEIKPSKHLPNMQGMNHTDMVHYVKAAFNRYGPDELMIHWDTIPANSELTLYLPGVTADEILQLATYTRNSKHSLEKVDEHTIRCLQGDISYVPIPKREGNLAGLLSIRLPDNVVKGQEFNMLVQQYDGIHRQIIGSFKVKIPVGVAVNLLPVFARQLSVLRHIALAIPTDNRWHPVFGRYLGHLADKVRGLGGNPDTIAPSPDGDGKPQNPTSTGQGETSCNCLMLTWWLILSTALLFILPATVLSNTTAVLGIATVLFVIVLASIYLLRAKCKECPCRWLSGLLTGSAIATGILGLAHLGGMGSAHLTNVLAVSGIAVFVLAIVSFFKKCWCKD
jgi:Domain of unknown function (DUF1929)